MLCPYCGTPVSVTTHTDGGATVTEMRCPVCAEQPPGAASAERIAACQADAAIGTPALLDLINWTLDRLHPDQAAGPAVAVAIVATLRCVAIVARSAAPFEQRRGVTDRLLAGLLNTLRSRLDRKDGE